MRCDAGFDIEASSGEQWRDDDGFEHAAAFGEQGRGDAGLELGVGSGEQGRGDAGFDLEASSGEQGRAETYPTDIGQWSDKLTESFREYWVKKGGSTCQNIGANFSQSLQQDGKQKHYFSSTLFFHTHSGNGEANLSDMVMLLT